MMVDLLTAKPLYCWTTCERVTRAKDADGIDVRIEELWRGHN